MTPYSKILIVGPTRSGTTFFSNALSLNARPSAGEITDKHTLLYIDEKKNIQKKDLDLPDSSVLEKNYNLLKKRKKWVVKFMTNHSSGSKELFEKYYDIADRIFYLKRDIIDIIISLNDATSSSIWNLRQDIKLEEGPTQNIEWVLSKSEILYNAKIIKDFEDYIYENFSGSSKMVFLTYKDNLEEYERLIKYHRGTIKKYKIQKIASRDDYKNKYVINYNLQDRKNYLQELLKDII